MRKIKTATITKTKTMATTRTLYSPKYHCKVADEGIEYTWGFLKKKLHHLPLSSRKTLKTFLECICKCLEVSTTEKNWRFQGRARKYMMVYKEVCYNKIKYNDVQKQVTFMYKPESEQIHRRSRKNFEKVEKNLKSQ